MAAEDILGHAVQRLLRADLDKDPGTGVVQRFQALDELHRLGDLTAEQLDDLVVAVRAGRVETAVDIGDDRDLRRLDRQAAQLLLQRDAGRRHDRSVERVAHGQLDGGAAGAVMRSMTFSTAGVAPPMTAWWPLLTLAMTT